MVVKYGNQITTLPLLVVKGEGPSLLGRNWLGVLNAPINIMPHSLPLGQRWGEDGGIINFRRRTFSEGVGV